MPRRVRVRFALPALAVAGLLLLAAVAALAPPARADTATIEAPRDTWVDKTQQSFSGSNDATALLNANAQKTKWAFFMAPAMNSIPAGATVTGVDVIVNPRETDGQTLTVHKPANCWAQSANVTWTTAQTTYLPGSALGSAAGTTAGVDKVIPMSLPLDPMFQTNGDWCIALKTSFSSKSQNRGVETSNDTVAPAVPVRFRITWTTAATTTTTSTTTTLPPTTTSTTTTLPPTTTTLPPPCGGPITITTGGVYSGCYESLTSTPAVRISTTQLVILDHATIRHTGIGALWGVAGTRLRSYDSTYQALDPGTGPHDQRAVKVLEPAEFIFENNRLIDGQGILVNVNHRTIPSPMQVRYNDVLNLGRYPPAELIQFIQLTLGDTPAATGPDIAWNRVTNLFGQSQVEDNINVFDSEGTVATPIDIHHNLVDGGYPTTVTGGYSGCGINAEAHSAWVRIHDNTVIGTTNCGLGLHGGHDNHEYANRVVSDGRNEAGQLLTAANIGMSLWNIGSEPEWANNRMTDNTVGWIRNNAGTPVRNDWWMPDCAPAGSCIGNVSLPNPIDATDEQAERDAWEAARAAAGVTVGVRS
jgi:hypothetical protein